MKTWLIDTGNKRKIKMRGETVQDAVRKYGKKYPNKKIKCGLLVRVWSDGIGAYWSGKEFLRCLN